MDWVRDIVLNMHGQDLTALKNAMDDGGDAHNIHKLIYNDILVRIMHCNPHCMSCKQIILLSSCITHLHTIFEVLQAVASLLLLIH